MKSFIDDIKHMQCIKALEIDKHFVNAIKLVKVCCTITKNS